MFTFNPESMRDGLGSVYDRLVSITRIADHAGPLMEHWERIMIEDNLEGVLAGTDKMGQPAPPLRYRPVNAKPMTVEQRLGQHPRKQRGDYYGKGSYKLYGLQPNNNLTTSEYRKLTGPRLAPRFQFSRVISNLQSGFGRRDDSNANRWFAECRWVEVVNKDGDTFLHYHFDGALGVNRPYDLRGVRPAGQVKMRVAFHEWAKDAIRRLWNPSSATMRAA